MIFKFKLSKFSFHLMSTMYIRNFRTLYVTRINIRIIIACIPNLDGLSEVTIRYVKNIHSPQVMAGNKDVRKLFIKRKHTIHPCPDVIFISIYFLISYVIETLCR